MVDSCVIGVVEESRRRLGCGGRKTLDQISARWLLSKETDC